MDLTQPLDFPDPLDGIKHIDDKIKEFQDSIEVLVSMRKTLIDEATEDGKTDNGHYRLVTPTKKRRTIIQEVLETKYPEVFDACKSVKVSVTLGAVEKYFREFRCGIPPECVNVEVSEGEPVLEVIGDA
jgi:hypothetical protein